MPCQLLMPSASSGHKKYPVNARAKGEMWDHLLKLGIKKAHTTKVYATYSEYSPSSPHFPYRNNPGREH